MRSVLITFGLANLSSTELSLLAVAVFVTVSVIGWLADGLLGDGAFGIVLNALLMLAGAIIGVYLWRTLGFSRGGNADFATLLVAAASGLGVLVIAAATRRWT